MNFLPSRWTTMMMLVAIALLGMTLCLSSNKIFVMWIGLELKMFGIIPLLNLEKSKLSSQMLTSSKKTKVSFFYFFVQVLGSLFFAWGAMLGKWYMLSVMGLALKLGIPPFFFWVPAVISRLDWFSVGFISTFQKIPGLVLFRIAFDINLKVCMLISLLGVGISSLGILYSYKSLKKIVSWSSMKNSSMLFLLLTLDMRLGMTYFIFYSVLMMMLSGFLEDNNTNLVKSSFTNGASNRINSLVSVALLVFSGLPPFVGFLMKMTFFSSLFLKDSCHMLMDIDLKGKETSFFFLLGSFLDKWSMVIMFLFFTMIQAMGYMKGFMKIKCKSMSRLQAITLYKKSNYFLFFMKFMIYFFSLMVMWI